MANFLQVLKDVAVQKETSVNVKEEIVDDIEPQLNYSRCKDVFNLEDDTIKHTHGRQPAVDIGEMDKKELQCTIGNELIHLESKLKNDLIKQHSYYQSDAFFKEEPESTLKTEETDIAYDEYRIPSPKNIQTPQSSFSCDNCMTSFPKRSSLKTHMRIHTGERPYSCDICKKRFTLSGNLKEHMITHTGEKTYFCAICNNSFSTSRLLKRHMLTHTGEKPFSCDVCNKGFSQSGNLKRHVTTHTGEKPYSCSVCKKRFSESGSLKKHMISHTGEKPHSCDSCNKSFSRSGHLKNHMKIHNGEN